MTLVPISIEKSFSSIKEIILLGDWCINSYTSAIPKKNILSYHWTDKNKLDKTISKINIFVLFLKNLKIKNVRIGQTR